MTFTCDPIKLTQESFMKKLRKCLANLHTRRGWRYMGVFEYGEVTGAIHFHVLLYVPENCGYMVQVGDGSSANCRDLYWT